LPVAAVTIAHPLSVNWVLSNACGQDLEGSAGINHHV